MQEALLLKGYQFRDIVLKNRMIMAPMVTLYAGQDGSATERMVNYYAERARGGVGLIVVESTYTCSGGHPGRLGIYDDKYIPGFAKIVEAVHREGAVVAIQLNPHRGRLSEVDPISASDIPHPVTGLKPRAILEEELLRLIEQFGEGVKRVSEIGFDGVMIHGASGYLVSDFLSPLTNKRKDQYGGSLEGRAKLALELVGQVKKYGPGLINSFRMGADEHVVGGISLEESIALARMLEKAGVELIDVVSGTSQSREWVVPPMVIPQACNAYLAEFIKNAVSIPVSVAGRINQYDIAQDIINSKKADFVTLGRPLIADPEFCRKLSGGNTDELRPCIACNECYHRTGSKEPLACTVNPEAGREGQLPIAPAEHGRKIAVIGGGPGGMEAARVCALRGHQVTLYERDRLGSTLEDASRPSFKKDLLFLTRYYKAQLQKLGVQIEYKDADAAGLSRYDAAIVSVGGRPFAPDVPGINNPNVVNWIEVLKGNTDPGHKVLIIGGGMIGIEVALYLALQGRQVIVTEMKDLVFTGLDNPTKSLYEKLFAQLKIIVLTGRTLQGFTENTASFNNREGYKETIKADTFVLATGLAPQSYLIEQLKKQTALEVYGVGDCVEPRKIINAIHEGNEVARKI